MKGITDIKSAVIQMNSFGAAGEPFLFAFDYELSEALFVPAPLDDSEILFRFGGVSNYRRPDDCSAKDPALRIVKQVEYPEYEDKFGTILKGLSRGDSYLANLTCSTEVESDVSLKEIFLATESLFGVYLPGRFVSFSPERFVRIENGVISCCPMKGTINAAEPDAEYRILHDYKESCEHNTITDLIRNDLGMVSERVWVERFRYIDRIVTDRGEILQVSSDVRGELNQGWQNRLGSLILNLLPAGSISGAPKPSTVKLIASAEQERRGFYTGIAGYFDGKVLDSAVLIRFIEEREGGKLFYRSGGGITVNSDVRDEYEEMLAKIYLPLRKICAGY